ncbi:leucine-rich repeat extensin-like protein 5 [Helianthus annuus]|uniref:leucine-rich repeat extensin-like protein 5 n=1 Tax=Helianthus annuus TaxID=4232 RepID=UPI000B900602|nr:leucine-rich repeat extensin-like protein 5 [Helianthus annuus]
MSTSPQEDWRTYLESARRSVSLSSSPSYHDSFGLHQGNESDHSRHSYLPLQWSGSHRAFEDPTPYFQSQFNLANQVQGPVDLNPLGPEDHYSGDQAMDMDDDPDPEMPPSGMPTHPIEISDVSRFVVPRSRQLRSKAVTPPPPPEQQPPPEPPRRRRSDARMSVRGGFHFSTPQHSSGSHYPPLYEDPQMGGPSNPVSEVESAQVAPPPSHMGYDYPIPSNAGAAAYNPFEQPVHIGYNYYNAPDVDPYLVAANYNALHPEGPYRAPYQTGYPAYGYQYPPPPQHP